MENQRWDEWKIAEGTNRGPQRGQSGKPPMMARADPGGTGRTNIIRTEEPERRPKESPSRTRGPQETLEYLRVSTSDDRARLGSSTKVRAMGGGPPPPAVPGLRKTGATFLFPERSSAKRIQAGGSALDDKLSSTKGGGKAHPWWLPYLIPFSTCAREKISY
jgi:hypothetical protein